MALVEEPADVFLDLYMIGSSMKHAMAEPHSIAMGIGEERDISAIIVRSN